VEIPYVKEIPLHKQNIKKYLYYFNIYVIMLIVKEEREK